MAYSSVIYKLLLYCISKLKVSVQEKLKGYLYFVFRILTWSVIVVSYSW